jgi:hypothetical protein
MPISRFDRVAVAAIGVVLACAFSACQSGDASTRTTTQRALPRIEAVPTSGLGLSVDEAYAAIPHRRTAIQFTSSKIPKADQDYLQIAFTAIDQAVLLRVSTLQSFSRGRTADSSAIRSMDRLIEFLHSVDPRPHLKTYHKRIEQAMSDQRAFFDDWRSRGSDFQYARGAGLGSHPSRQLLERTQGDLRNLMQSYPAENRHNKEAFFDYHASIFLEAET